MLVVTDLNGNCEMLTDVKGIEQYEERNGDFSLSFTVFNTENNKHAYDLLQEESVVELNGHEFKVKQLVDVRNGKSVRAQHIFFDLIGKRKDDIFGGTKTANEMFGWLLAGTGWTYEVVDAIPAALFPNFGNANVLSLIRSACGTFDCSVKIEPNKHLKVGMRVGSDKDEQFRYKHNIKTLKKTVDTTNLATKIKGFGGNGLEVTYTSPMTSVYGEIWAEPVEDERFTIAASLTQRVKQELQDVPEISIEIETITLGMDVTLDDGVWTIYEPLGIEYLSYVTAIKSYPFTNKSSVVTISNVKKTITDILAQTKIEIDENKKETRSKIEQTNERITLEVERVDESIATLDIKADNIILSVSDLRDDVNSNSASLSIQAGLISTKVSRGDVISSINQSAEAVTIQASKINLEGVVTTNDIQIGNKISLGDRNWASAKTIVFNGDGAWITATGDSMSLHASSGIGFFGHTYFMQGVDFSRASVTWGSNAPVAKFG